MAKTFGARKMLIWYQKCCQRLVAQWYKTEPNVTVKGSILVAENDFSNSQKSVIYGYNFM